MKYKIVHGDDEDELTVKVNEAMQEGWVAQGGVMVLVNTFSKGSYPHDHHGGETAVLEPYSDEWHQAMVKRTTFSFSSEMTEADKQEAKTAIEEAALEKAKTSRIDPDPGW